MRLFALVIVSLVLAMPLPVRAETAKAPPRKAASVAKPGPAAAESRHSGLAAAAARGDAEAQYQLALAYRDGHGVKADAKMALAWFTLAGANGSALAAIEAARAFEAGRGATRGLTEAGQWWYRAAQLGDVSARNRWLELFLSGRIVSVGGVAGADWVADTAGRGNVRAAMALAEAYDKGLGVAPNPSAAEGWYRLAALLHADIDARYRLGRMLLAGGAVWRVPGDEEWNPKEAERRGRPFGAVWSAAKPAGVDDDKVVQLRPGIVEGERWLDSAARQGHADAQYALGMAMVGGIELPLDMASGISWLEAAAAQNHPDAMMALADFAAKGQGFFAKDPIRAFVMYDFAAQLGEDGAAEARDALARTLNQKQAARAHQVAQEIRELTGR